MSTIMGQIQFMGADHNAGDILLESDHGPVGKKGKRAEGGEREGESHYRGYPKNPGRRAARYLFSLHLLGEVELFEIPPFIVHDPLGFLAIPAHMRIIDPSAAPEIGIDIPRNTG